MKKNDVPCVQKTITGFIALNGSQIFHQNEPKMTDANKLLERAAILLRKTKTFSGVALDAVIRSRENDR